MDDNWVKLILLIIMAIFLIIFFLAGWQWGSKLCSCCRCSKKPAADSEAGLELKTVKLPKLNVDKDAQQKAENDATRERAQGSGTPHGTTMSGALGAGHPRVTSFEAIKSAAKIPGGLDKRAFETFTGRDEVVFDEDDFRENEEVHPHEVEVKKPNGISKKITDVRPCVPRNPAYRENREVL